MAPSGTCWSPRDRRLFALQAKSSSLSTKEAWVCGQHGGGVLPRPESPFQGLPGHALRIQPCGQHRDGGILERRRPSAGSTSPATRTQHKRAALPSTRRGRVLGLEIGSARERRGERPGTLRCAEPVAASLSAGTGTRPLTWRPFGKKMVEAGRSGATEGEEADAEAEPVRPVSPRVSRRRRRGLSPERRLVEVTCPIATRSIMDPPLPLPGEGRRHSSICLAMISFMISEVATADGQQADVAEESLDSIGYSRACSP